MTDALLLPIGLCIIMKSWSLASAKLWTVEDDWRRTWRNRQLSIGRLTSAWTALNQTSFSWERQETNTWCKSSRQNPGSKWPAVAKTKDTWLMHFPFLTVFQVVDSERCSAEEAERVAGQWEHWRVSTHRRWEAARGLAGGRGVFTVRELVTCFVCRPREEFHGVWNIFCKPHRIIQNVTKKESLVKDAELVFTHSAIEWLCLEGRPQTCKKSLVGFWNSREEKKDTILLSVSLKLKARFCLNYMRNWQSS